MPHDRRFNLLDLLNGFGLPDRRGLPLLRIVMLLTPHNQLPYAGIAEWARDELGAEFCRRQTTGASEPTPSRILACNPRMHHSRQCRSLL